LRQAHFSVSLGQVGSVKHPYLQDQLIAYIGNKRALQPFLAGAFTRLVRPGAVFLDPFAGSGAVARLARYLGCRVLANDWEPYAYMLNYAYLCVGKSESEGLFRERGWMRGVLEELNALPDPPPARQYIARHYAPRRTEEADYRTERLFYTRENALRIDALRNRLEELYPGFEPEGPAKKEKYLLLASLLFGAATHVNTSGVFKACHKGFGGHGRDALGRILAPIRLQAPELLDGPQAEAGCLDAASFVRGRPADLCYLDPPYNQHQYGSNYHLLNTIALWDRPEVSDERRPDGRLRHKAGIRADWVRTRSPFCYRQSALPALERLLEEVDARVLALSYNTEGLIPLEELVALLESQGAVQVHGSEYVKYRGGRQSIGRRVHNLELLLVLQRGRRSSPRQREAVRRLLLEQRLRLLLRGGFDPEVLARAFPLLEDGQGIRVRLGARELAAGMEHRYRFKPEAAEALAEASRAEELKASELEGLYRSLEACACPDREQEIRVLLGILAQEREPRGREALERRLLWLLKKLAHRKYRERFQALVARLEREVQRDPEGHRMLAEGLPALERQAAARFAG
jgi:adenine-specific DNA-methyltransferase